MRLLIINHSFQKKEFYKRWQKLANDHEDLDITLLAPREWAWGVERNLTYGQTERIEGVVIEEDRFRIHLIDIKKNQIGEWTSKKMVEEIRAAKPDIVYYIGGTTVLPVMQILLMRKQYNLSNTKVLCFSMRGYTSVMSRHLKSRTVKSFLRQVIDIIYTKCKLLIFNHYCDAVFCHYPEALQAFREDGYKKSIYMQTQVGVDPDIFYPNETSREKIRQKYNIGDSYLFGSASRFHYSKGLSEIIRALPNEGNWKYLMMGWGRDDEVEKIKKEIKDKGLEDKVILTGYIDNWTDMAEHLNALDCAIHTPLTTQDWEETFSLALIQEMITGLPVIGSTSGSVPYQIGEDGIIVPEGNNDALRDQMVNMMNNPEKGRRIGALMRARALDCFSIYHLNELFYLTIKDIANDIYDEAKVDMAKYRG